jgi:hypothetical protein
VKLCSIVRSAATALLVASIFVGPVSQAAEPIGGSVSGGAWGQPDNAEVARTLSNPVFDTWALFTEFDLFFSDGDVVRGGKRSVVPPL